MPDEVVHRKKWLKRTLLALAAVLAMAAGVSYWLFRDTPDWYQPLSWDKDRYEALASSAEDEYVKAKNWAEKLKVDAGIAYRARQEGTTLPAGSSTDDPQEHVITFSDDQLNVLFRKWSQLNGWNERLARYVTDPILVLRDDRLILAGKLKDVGAVASFHFQPVMDERGALSLRLVRVLAGRLPMPDAVWESQRARMLGVLRQKLPVWQQAAQISSNGAANDSAIAAAMSKMLIHVVEGESTEPVAFIESVPVRIQDLEIRDHKMVITVRPLTPAERTALLQRIRAPFETASASAR